MCSKNKVKLPFKGKGKKEGKQPEETPNFAALFSFAWEYSPIKSFSLYFVESLLFVLSLGTHRKGNE